MAHNVGFPYYGKQDRHFFTSFLALRLSIRQRIANETINPNNVHCILIPPIFYRFCGKYQPQ